MKKTIIAIIISLLMIKGCSQSSIYDFNYYHNKQNNINNEKEEIIEDRKKIINKRNIIKNISNKYDILLEDIAKANDVTGMSVAVFKDGDIIHTFNYGYADIENNIKTNNKTKYRIASISKVITTIGLMRLYEKNMFELEDNISDITGIDYDSIYGDISFKNLLTHTAGINDYSNAYKKACNGNLLTIDQVISGSHLEKDVGSYYQYSNLGLSSVGAIIERMTEEYFGDYMRKLFESLNIDAAYSSDYIENKDNIAKLYDNGITYDVKNWFKVSDWYKKYGLGNSYLQGDGELIISAVDLAKFGIALAGDGTYKNNKILDEETVKIMISDYLDVFEDGKYKYSEGLSCHNFKDLLENREIHGHTGSAYGVITALYFDPKDHSGVVILDNYAKNIKDEYFRTLLLYDTLKATYDLYFNDDMNIIYEN